MDGKEEQIKGRIEALENEAVQVSKNSGMSNKKKTELLEQNRRDIAKLQQVLRINVTRRTEDALQDVNIQLQRKRLLEFQNISRNSSRRNQGLTRNKNDGKSWAQFASEWERTDKHGRTPKTTPSRFEEFAESRFVEINTDIEEEDNEQETELTNQGVIIELQRIEAESNENSREMKKLLNLFKTCEREQEEEENQRNQVRQWQ